MRKSTIEDVSPVKTQVSLCIQSLIRVFAECFVNILGSKKVNRKVQSATQSEVAATLSRGRGKRHNHHMQNKQTQEKLTDQLSLHQVR